MSRLVLFTAPDLLTGARIEETARAAGIKTRAVAGDSLAAACRERVPDLVVIDLTAPGDVPGWIRALKADPATAAVPVLGFYPHVRDELRRSAVAAGADRVLPRSAFVSRMPAWLAGTGPAGATLPGRSEPPSSRETDERP